MSDNLKEKNIVLVGVGAISHDYIKILNDLGCKYVVVGRSQENVQKFTEATGIAAVAGGIELFLSDNKIKIDAAIVAVGVEALAGATKSLLQHGIKNILVEKPGGSGMEEIVQLSELAKQKNANVFLAYNRRFYASVIHAKNKITEDGGVSSFNFEFTEWSHIIEKLEKPSVVLQNWVLSNSSHVIDTAFYLGGKPKELSVYTQKGNLTWHPNSSVFSGAGISEKGALFSYQANWQAPGRWSVEMLTKNHRFILRPMEKLQIQKTGSVAIEMVEGIDYLLDEKYKPGLFLQVKSFLTGEHSNFCTIHQQKEAVLNYYMKIAGYKEVFENNI